jgi:hypothetical protein
MDLIAGCYSNVGSGGCQARIHVDCGQQTEDYVLGRSLSRELFIGHPILGVILHCEQDKFISEIWDREVLRLSFRRTVDRALMTQWEELTQIVNCIHLSDEEDVIVWHYTSSCVYSAQSLYAIVNNRGVRQIYTPVV